MRIIQPGNKASAANEAQLSDSLREPDAVSAVKPQSGRIPAQELQAVADKKQHDLLFASGVRLLSMREHSLAELESKLSGKTQSADLLFAVLDELKAANYQSDSRFTESFVRSRTNRGYGPIRIRKELKLKGIKNNMIEDNMDVNSAVWFENARIQYHKKYGEDPVSDYNAWTKRARFMQSRGFSSEHIQVTLPSVQND